MALLTIYEHDNFGGRSAQVSKNYPNLSEFWNDKITSAVVHSGTWRVYEHADYQGRSMTLTRGEYRNISHSPGGLSNDTISSIKLVSD